MSSRRTSEPEPVPGEPVDPDALLRRWRERLLGGVILVSLAALAPPVLVQAWQVAHGLQSARGGLILSLAAMLGLVAIRAWRGPLERRAATVIGMGVALVCAAILSEGLAPAQLVALCMVTSLGVLLRSTRVALLILLAAGLSMALGAYLFSRGFLLPLARDHLDPTEPLNWLRVGLYTLFPTATSAMATSYLLGKLRSTLQARNELVLRLSEEVAQRKRAFAELERTQAQLLQAQKLEAIGQLAAGIAHDFNNTLSVVALEAELLKRRASDPNTVARGAEALLGAAERARLLTRQLLSFGRVESSTRPVVDVARVFEECASALRRLLPSELTFELDVGPGQLPVCIHDSELHQLVLNLGINARDALAGTGKLRISLERVELEGLPAAAHGVVPGAYALLTCKDTGCGMDAATLSRMFEPFFTTKGAGRGTGLGLTNVWTIVQRARGTVQVESAPGVGTTLRVYLPLSAQAPRDSVVPPRLMDPHGTETVLVVEDDIRVRALVVTLLADAGYQVLDASSVDAALALEQVHLGAIDLVCTDVVMAGRPARELVSELRSRRPNAGILVCSGYSEDEQLARGIQSGEFKHLGKPFTRMALLAAVRGALDRS